MVDIIPAVQHDASQWLRNRHDRTAPSSSFCDLLRCSLGDKAGSAYPLPGQRKPRILQDRGVFLWVLL